VLVYAVLVYAVLVYAVLVYAVLVYAALKVSSCACVCTCAFLRVAYMWSYSKFQETLRSRQAALLVYTCVPFCVLRTCSRTHGKVGEGVHVIACLCFSLGHARSLLMTPIGL